jgi:hypothetical protein
MQHNSNLLTEKTGHSRVQLRRADMQSPGVLAVNSGSDLSSVTQCWSWRSLLASCAENDVAEFLWLAAYNRGHPQLCV